MPAAGLSIHPQVSTRQSTFEGIPIREDTAYSNAHGKEKSGTRKRTQKALGKLRETLLRVLAPDEAVFYVARARSMPSMLDEFFLGWLAYATQGGLVILTNRRLLYFITDKAGGWKRSLSVVQWGDIEKGQVKGWLNHLLVLKYRNGSKETFWKLRGDDAKKIKVLLAALLPSSGGETSPAQGMVHLCPKCLSPLQAGVYQCAKCGELFKDEKTLVRRWRIFPALGYSYTGHHGLAALDFLIEAFILLEIILILIIAVPATMAPHLTPRVSTALAGLWVEIGFFVAAWVLKRWLMLRQCRRFVREFIPAKT